MHISPPYNHLPVFEINRQVLRAERRNRISGGVSPQSSADSRKQFFNSKRFDDVIIGAGVEGDDFVALVASLIS
jgi:hypothetical protein